MILRNVAYVNLLSSMRAGQPAVVRPGGRHGAGVGRSQRINKAAMAALFSSNAMKKARPGGALEGCPRRGRCTAWRRPICAFRHRAGRALSSLSGLPMADLIQDRAMLFSWRLRRGSSPSGKSASTHATWKSAPRSRTISCATGRLSAAAPRPARKALFFNLCWLRARLSQTMEIGVARTAIHR